MIGLPTRARTLSLLNPSRQLVLFFCAFTQWHFVTVVCLCHSESLRKWKTFTSTHFRAYFIWLGDYVCAQDNKIKSSLRNSCLDSRAHLRSTYSSFWFRQWNLNGQYSMGFYFGFICFDYGKIVCLFCFHTHCISFCAHAFSFRAAIKMCTTKATYAKTQHHFPDAHTNEHKHEDHSKWNAICRSNVVCACVRSVCGNIKCVRLVVFEQHNEYVSRC